MSAAREDGIATEQPLTKSARIGSGTRYEHQVVLRGLKWEHSFRSRTIRSSPISRPGTCRTPDQVNALVDDAYARYKANTEGEVSQVYPALARVPSDLFGICVVGTSGNVYAVGDTDYPFTDHERLQAFRFRSRLSIDRLGAGARENRGEQHRAAVQFAGGRRTERRRADEPDGQCRGDRDDQSRSGRYHRGAVAVHSRRLVAVCRAGTLPLNDEVYASACETNFRNRSIVQLLHSLRPRLLRPGRSRRPLYQAVLAERHAPGTLR